MPKVYCNLQDENYPYLYCPSLPAAKTFTILFALTTLGHITQAVVYRKKFCWVICMGALWETLSFTMRWLSIYSPDGFSEPAQLLVLLAPLWINAFCYMIMGRVVLYFLPEQKLLGISARRLTLIFVLLDVLSFLIQATGGVMADSTTNLLQTGLHIYEGGIGLQQLFVVIFFALAMWTQIQISRVHENHRTQNWRKAIWPMYGALVLITVRIIYRLVEYSGGFDTGLVRQEKWLYILEASPMFLCLFLFNVCHPGTVLVGPESEFPKKEKKAKKDKKGKKDKNRTDSETAIVLDPMYSNPQTQTV